MCYSRNNSLTDEIIDRMYDLFILLRYFLYAQNRRKFVISIRNRKPNFLLFFRYDETLESI